MCTCFFFSSRRRHTRFDCDWSSDVCSSDLTSFRPKKVACSVVEHPIVGEADRPIMRKLVADIASTVNQSPHGGISAEIQRDPVKVSEESPRRREWVVLDLLVFLFGLRPLPAERPVSSPDIRQTLANT